MKKRALSIIIFVLIAGLLLPAVAENQYEGKSLSELKMEISRIIKAMWETQEWEEVVVPAGVYLVGVDIPAKEWVIKNSSWFSVDMGEKINETKTEVDVWGSNNWWGEVVKVEEYPNGITVNLIKGYYISFNKAVIFTTPTGDKGFTFK